MTVEPTAHDEEFQRVLQWLAHRTGLVFRPDQHRHTIGVIRRVMDSFEVTDPAQIPSTLESRSDVLAELINQLTVGETYFFREPRHFQFIQERVLPEVRSRRGSSHTIRAWSAGCASGEEAYSLAIVCHRSGLSSSVRILATDLSREALERARRAVFRPWSFRGNAATEVAAYATRQGDEYILHDQIKKMVTFRELNLAANEYPSVINGTADTDLIMCRNVLIYFSRPTVEAITKRLFDSLAKGGWLVTASGDPPLGDHANWEVITGGDGTFYRKPLEVAPVKRGDRHSAVPLAAPPSAVRTPANIADRRDRNSNPVISTAAHSRVSDVQSINPPAKVNSPAKENRSVSANGRVSFANPRVTVATAAAALDDGDYQRAAELTAPLREDPKACIIHIKSLASIDQEAALARCREASEQHALEEELHYLYALLLADADRTMEALQSVQKAIFLNRSLVMGHFLFGSLQAQQGEWSSASRHFRRVCELCAAHEPNDIVPLSSGETVADIATAAEARLSRLQSMLDE